MGWNDHIDFELHQQVSDAVDEGYLEEGTPEYGIAQQAIDRGCHSLSEKQKWVFDHKLWPILGRMQAVHDLQRRRELLERND